MADKLTYTIEVDSSDFTAKIKGMEDTVAGLKKQGDKGGIFKDLLNFELVKQAFNQITGFFKAAINEALDAIRTNAAWVSSIDKVGLSYKQASKDVQELADINVIDDDDVKKLYNYGAAIGISGDKLKQFTQTTLDYIASTGKDFGLSMRTVGTLAKENADKFNELSARVKGASADVANADGGFKALQTTLKKVLETAGTDMLVAIAPTLKRLNEFLIKLMQVYEKVFGTPEEKLKKVNTQIEENTRKMAAYQEKLKGMNWFDKAITTTERDYKTLKGQTEELIVQKDMLERQVGIKKTIVVTDESILDTSKKQKDLIKDENSDLDIQKQIKQQLVDFQRQEKELNDQYNSSVSSLLGTFKEIIGTQDESLNQVLNIVSQANNIFTAYTQIQAAIKAAETAQYALNIATQNWVALLGVAVVAIAGVFNTMFNSLGNAEQANRRWAAQQMFNNSQTRRQVELLDDVNAKLEQANKLLGEDEKIQLETNESVQQHIDDIKTTIQLEKDKNKITFDGIKAAEDAVKDNAEKRKKLNKDLIDLQIKLNLISSPTGKLTQAQYQEKLTIEEKIKQIKRDVDILDKNDILQKETRNKLLLDSADIITNINELEKTLTAELNKQKVVKEETNLTEKEKLKELLILQDELNNGNVFAQENYKKMLDIYKSQIDSLTELINLTDDENQKMDYRLQLQKLTNELTQYFYEYQDQQNIKNKDAVIELLELKKKFASPEQAKKYEDEIQSTMESQIAYLENMINITNNQTDKVQLQIELQKKQNDLAERRLQTEESISNEIYNKRLQKLKDMVSLGLIDVQSYTGQSQIRKSLADIGLTGTAAALAAKDIGVRTSDILSKNTRINQINVTNYEANLNSVSGSISMAISKRL